MAHQYPRILTETTRAVAVASAQSAAFSAGTLAIYLKSDVRCFVQINDNPTATTAAPSIPIEAHADWAGPFTNYDGGVTGNKVAAIRDTTDGTLFILQTTGVLP